VEIPRTRHSHCLTSISGSTTWFLQCCSRLLSFPLWLFPLYPILVSLPPLQSFQFLFVAVVSGSSWVGCSICMQIFTLNNFHHIPNKPQKEISWNEKTLGRICWRWKRKQISGFIISTTYPLQYGDFKKNLFSFGESLFLGNEKQAHQARSILIVVSNFNKDESIRFQRMRHMKSWDKCFYLWWPFFLELLGQK